MIVSSRQYAVTQAQLEKFQYALLYLDEHIKAAGSDRPLLSKAHRSALESQIVILRQELAAWEELPQKTKDLADAMQNLTQEDIERAILDMGKRLNILPDEET